MNLNYGLLVLFLLYLCYKYYYYKYPTYITHSDINGEGLFANTHFNKNDIILNDIFPNKPSHIKLINPISKDKFSNYISLEGSKINHCSQDTNSDIVTTDNKTYRLIATKPIQKGSEIKCNYDNVNNRYPFIAGSEPFFKKC